MDSRSLVTRNNMDILISIIIPCFNQSRYMETVVHSVLAQTCSDYEIILVNDGSTDETPQILAALAARHPGRITVVEQANQGLSMARQAGLDNARGEYIVFLDADDQLNPLMMAACLAAFRERPTASAVAGNTQLIYEHAPELARILRIGRNTHWPAILESNPFGACCSLMLKKAKIIEAGGVGLPGVRACEDWDLYARMARRGMRFQCIPVVLSRYLQHENGLSHDIEKMLAAKLAMLDRLTVDGGFKEDGLNRYRNGYALYALGQAVGRRFNREVLASILAQTPPGEPDFRYHCNQFLYGLQHSVLLNHQAIEPRYREEVCELIAARFREIGYGNGARMFLGELRREMKYPLKRRSLARALSRLMDPARKFWFAR